MATTSSNILPNISTHSETPATSHSREVSTVSSATLHTNTTATVHSQPTEPLLRPTTPLAGPGQYYNVPSPRSRKSDRSLARPRSSQIHLMTSQHPTATAGDKSLRTPRKRVKLLRWIKDALVVVMGLWAVFNTVRYFMAFCIYSSNTGQALALTLGVFTGLSFAFTCCATILGFFQPRLLVHGFPVQTLLSMRSALQYSASGCLLGPSIVNFVLIFVWKKTTDLELQTRHRCRLDIDLVWSPPFSLCNHKTRTWGLWLALSAIRVVVTLIIIITFHFIASSTQLKLIKRTKRRHPRHEKGHNRLESYLTPLIPENHLPKSFVAESHLGPDSNLPYQSSDSTLSTTASPRNRFRPNRSRQSPFRDDDTQTESLDYNKEDFLPMNSEPEGESNSFVHRFRTLISQITRETEDGIAFARSEGSGSSHRDIDSPPDGSPELGAEVVYRSDRQEGYDNDDGFYTSSTTHIHDAYEQHQQQYPSGEEIRMLNGFIRRMPTIESMGSRELRSSIGASSANRDGRSPTRITLGSRVGTDFSGNSEHHSGTSRLTAQAEVLAGTYHLTEIGELVGRGDTIRMVDISSTNIDNSRSLGASTNSSSVLSYLTAPDSVSRSLVIPDMSSSHIPSPRTSEPEGE